MLCLHLRHCQMLSITWLAMTTGRDCNTGECNAEDIAEVPHSLPGGSEEAACPGMPGLHEEQPCLCAYCCADQPAHLARHISFIHGGHTHDPVLSCSACPHNKQHTSSTSHWYALNMGCISPDPTTTRSTRTVVHKVTLPKPGSTHFHIMTGFT